MKLAKLLFVLAVFAAPVGAGEWHASAGKILPTGKGEVTGIGSIGYRGEKYDVTLLYAAQSSVYTPDTRVPEFVMLSVSRAWTYDAKFLGANPTFLMGLSFKGSDRCAYNGEVDCNRRLPLPVNFHFGVGLEWQAIRVELFHDSNNAMDHGPEKKNLGMNWLTLTYRIGR